MGAKGSTVAPIKQLSESQIHILEWLGREEERVLGSKDEAAIQELHEKGVPWSVANLYRAKPPKNASVNVSKALRRLQARGLVSLYDSTEGSGAKTRTSHVTLTALGRTLAIYFALANKRLPPKLTFDATYMALSLELIELKQHYKEMLAVSKRLEDMYSSHLLMKNASEDQMLKNRWTNMDLDISITEKGSGEPMSKNRRTNKKNLPLYPKACLQKITEVEAKLKALEIDMRKKN